ncbi:hypothetical protein INT44_004050 [Umbelopsis vinacea]|uniref:Uncharacterized protein n=1 Tax=Umbelopsis vinacea TaxID=44442 RepID=A0A8H7QBP9_9FUNG|nr:hypothetical protein INT44_004050 [Umbelopsis vinacea]
MVLWNALITLTLVAAFLNPESVYMATRQLQMVIKNLIEEVQLKKRSVASVFPQLLLVSGRLIVLMVLIIANCILGETISKTDKTVKTTAIAIQQVQQLAEPLPTESIHAVVESVKEKIDIPALGITASNDHHDGIVDPPSVKVDTQSMASGTDDTLENTSQCSEKTENDAEEQMQTSALKGKNGNSEQTVVDAHDVKNSELPVPPPPLEDINMVDPPKLTTSENVTEAQPDILPQIDGRQQSSSQIKRRSLLLPELNPPKQSIDKPRRKFSIQRSNETSDSKPKKLLSIFKKR